jgi:hypothetical protein
VTFGAGNVPQMTASCYNISLMLYFNLSPLLRCVAEFTITLVLIRRDYSLGIFPTSIKLAVSIFCSLDAGGSYDTSTGPDDYIAE